MRERFARLLLFVAGSAPGGILAALAVRWAPRLLPVRLLARTPAVVAFPHPRPIAPGHVVLVARRRVRSLCALAASGDPGPLLALVDLARQIAATLPPRGRVIAINAGARQDVGQLHAHLLPRSAVDRSLAGLEPARVHLDDPAEVRAMLDAAAPLLGDCDDPMGGTLVLLDFDADVTRWVVDTSG